MRKYINLFFSALIFLLACNSTPNGIIKRDRMTSLLVDIHLTDGGLMNVIQVPDTLYKYGNARYLAVFKKYDTDSNQFRRSYKYYTTQPEVFAAMYDDVLKALQIKTDSLNALIAKQNTTQPYKNGMMGGKMNPGAMGKPVPPGNPPTYTPGTPGGPHYSPGAIIPLTPKQMKIKHKLDSIRQSYLNKRHAVPI